MKLAEKLADYATNNKAFVQKPSHLSATVLLEIQLFLQEVKNLLCKLFSY
jgi:hypothetical protein